MVLFLDQQVASAQTKNLPKKTKKSTEVKNDAQQEQAVITNDNSNMGTAVTEPRAFNGQPVLQFNTMGTPSNTSDRSTLQFKVPTDEKSLADDKMANPMESQKFETPFKAYVGYPKQQLNVNLSPTNYGGIFKNNTVGEFNFASQSPTALDLNYRFISTPILFFEGNLNYFTASTKAGNPGGYTVNASSQSVYTFFARANYCFISGSNFFAKLCPGGELGMDKYPLLGFVNGTTLEMTTASNISYGLNLFAQYPIVGNTLLQARLGYVMGTGSGQSGELTHKKDNSLYLNSNIEWPMMTGLMNVGFNYRTRTSTVEGKRGAFDDKWDTTTGLLAFNIGYTWQFDSN
jgi:hypothetical protein